MPHMLMVGAILVGIYFPLDSYYYQKEGITVPDEEGARAPLKIDRLHNFIFKS